MKHPKQREMWDGLSATGCCGLIVFFIMITTIAEYLLK